MEFSKHSVKLSLYPSAITWSIMASPYWFTPIAAALFMPCGLRY